MLRHSTLSCSANKRMTLYIYRSVGCQVNFDKHVCMYSSPMWEISSEESCLSHGCGYFNGWWFSFSMRVILRPYTITDLTDL